MMMRNRLIGTVRWYAIQPTVGTEKKVGEREFCLFVFSYSTIST